MDNLQQIENERKKNIEQRDIAVIGLACRFPKAKDKDAFWNNLMNGVDCVSEVPKDRWNTEEFYSEDIKEQNKTYNKWLGALEDIDLFDNQFFNISPREASNMDPNQRILLQEAWHCLEDSAIPLSELQRATTSVHVGSVAYDVYHPTKADVSTASGTYYFMLANRISYCLGLTGESQTMDTGCSSSFVALNSACRSLLDHSSDYAMVGGVNLHMSPYKYTTWSKSRMFSMSGKCHTFDKDADGYVPGEGVGVLLLAPLEKAIQNKNKIYAVIKGCAINHGGQALSLTAPNVNAQKSVIESAYRQTTFDPSTVTYVEAHGTGTSLGDPIEIEALKEVFEQYTNKRSYCKVGSVKTNIGHLEGCAAMASLIKVILMLQNKKIPKSLHLNQVNPVLNVKNSPFEFVNETTEWKRLEENIPLRAGISSFGIGGTNSHVLVEEYCPEIEKKEEIKLDQKKSFFILSARTQKSLNLALENWKININLGNLDAYKLEDISNVLMKSREQFSYRFGTIATDIHDVSKAIDEYTSKTDSIEIKPFLGMIGNNQYNGWSDLSDELTEIPCFIKELEHLHSEVLTAGISEDEWKEFQSNRWSNNKDRLYSFLLDVLLIRTYLNLGMKLDTISGYGMGSLVALVISNIVSIEDMIAHLQGTKKLEDITLSRPEIDFYDWKNQTTLKRYHIEKTYIDDLFRQISLPSEQCNEYFEKAKILYYNQFTFKKFMKEWDPYVSQWGDVEHMIKDIELSSEEINVSDTKRLALLIMIMSSLNRVNRKWNLTEDKVFTCSAIYELLNLITDNVIGKNDFIQLIQKKFDNQSYEVFIQSCNENINSRFIHNEYPILKHKELIEVNQKQKWMNDLELEKLELSDIKDHEIILFSSKTESFDTIQFNLLNTQKETNVYEFILQLWLHGQNITWSKINNCSNYQKISLPTYRFDENSYWENQVPYVMPNYTKNDTQSEDVNTLNSNSNDSVNLSEKVDENRVDVDDRECISLHPIWSRHDEAKQIAVDTSEDIVIFYQNYEEEIKKAFQDKFEGCQLHFIRITKSNNNQQMIQRQLMFLDKINQVYFITNLNTKIENNYELQSYQEAESNGVLCLLRVVKALHICGYSTRTLRMMVITNNTYNVTGDEKIIPFYSAVGGLTKSIATEFYRWKTICCDLDFAMIADNDSDAVVTSLKNVICETARDDKMEVAYRKGIRYERLLSETTMTATKENGFIKNGSYLIAGGNGGIGHELALYLAKNYQASISILGRSEMNEKIEANLEQIRAAGGKAIYVQTDVGDSNSVNMAVEETKKSFGTIDAVIHSAMVLRDSMLINMDEKSFEQALYPKILGTVNLYKAIQSDATQMLIFSSAESYLCFQGQSNYIAGCSFQDTFAGYVNSTKPGKVKVLNWGYWGEVGVASSKFYHDVFSKTGLLPIYNEEGLQAIDDMMKCDEQQVVFLKAKDELFNHLPMDEMFSTKTDQMKENQTDSSTSNQGISVADCICSAIKKALYIDDISVDEQSTFSDLGVDSIVELEMIEYLNGKLGIKLMPTDLFNYETIEQLTKYICSEFPQVLQMDAGNNESKEKTSEGINSSNEDKILSIKECICSSIKEALYIDDISVDEQSTFSDLGVDSIVELEMIEYLNGKLGIKLMPTDLFNYETIEQLTKYIQSEFSI